MLLLKLNYKLAEMTFGSENRLQTINYLDSAKTFLKKMQTAHESAILDAYAIRIEMYTGDLHFTKGSYFEALHCYQHTSVQFKRLHHGVEGPFG